MTATNMAHIATEKMYTGGLPVERLNISNWKYERSLAISLNPNDSTITAFDGRKTIKIFAPDVLKFEVVKNGTTVHTQTSGGSGALVGGILGGAAGAIIGASISRTSTSTPMITKYYMNFFCNDKSEPLKVIDMLGGDKEQFSEAEWGELFSKIENVTARISAFLYVNGNIKHD